MVGGGPGAFIGEVHRRAACLDGDVELVAGVRVASTAARSRRRGRELRLDPARVYGSYVAMLDGEMGRPPGERIDFVSIVTPNDTHAPIATAFLAAGVNVVCDKPMTLDVAEARALKRGAARSGVHLRPDPQLQSGYPMVKLARDLVAAGELGRVRKVVAEYRQGWLATPVERTGSKQARWRTDPRRSGAAGCVGDIGTHAAHLAEYVTGQRIARVSADLATFVPRRRLDDDGSVLVRFDGGARGVVLASQVAVGEENGLTLAVYGERGGVTWRQEEPNTLRVTIPRGAGGDLEPRPGPGGRREPGRGPARRGCRPGTRRRSSRRSPTSTEGRRNVCDTMRARRLGTPPRSAGPRLPDRRRRAARHVVHRGRGDERRRAGTSGPASPGREGVLRAGWPSTARAVPRRARWNVAGSLRRRSVPGSGFMPAQTPNAPVRARQRSRLRWPRAHRQSGATWFPYDGRAHRGSRRPRTEVLDMHRRDRTPFAALTPRPRPRAPDHGAGRVGRAGGRQPASFRLPMPCSRARRPGTG